MLNFAANLSQLYTHLDFLDRFDAAAADGFRGVEHRGPYDWPIEAVVERLHAAGLRQVQFNLPAGDWNAGERGIACLPGREAEFRAGLERAFDCAQALDCSRLNCLAGLMPPGVAYEELEETLVVNLSHACERLQGTGITLLIEPLNRQDLPTCMLVGTDNAERIIKRIASDTLKLQFDFYHTQVTEGNVLRRFERLLPLIGHVQVAQNPGRHEPDEGELDYARIFARIEQLAYDGWIGCEYVPRGDTSAGLSWMRRLSVTAQAQSPER